MAQHEVCIVLLLGQTQIFGDRNLLLPSRDSVWCVSCKSERAHYTQVHCMYMCMCVCVCMCTNMIFYILLGMWTFSCVVSIHLHEDIYLKLHLLDDLQLGTQTCHHPPVETEVSLLPVLPRMSSLTPGPSKRGIRNAARARLAGSINRLTSKLVL